MKNSSSSNIIIFSGVNQSIIYLFLKILTKVTDSKKKIQKKKIIASTPIFKQPPFHPRIP